jgi:hypothetical protein
MTARAEYAQAVDELAARVLRALGGGQGAGLLGDYVDQAGSVAAALAAVRVLGADALVAHLFMKMPLTGRENEVVAESLRLVPPPAATGDPHIGVIFAWRDWALAQVANRCCGDLPTIACPRDSVSADPDDWRSWSAAMAQLSVLAVPGLDSPIHELGRRHPLALARGATRAVLRRDHPMAAALGRWLALLHTQGVRLALDWALLAQHVGLLGGGEQRTALDAGIARNMLRAALG